MACHHHLAKDHLARLLPEESLLLLSPISPRRQVEVHWLHQHRLFRLHPEEDPHQLLHRVFPHLQDGVLWLPRLTYHHLQAGEFLHPRAVVSQILQHRVSRLLLDVVRLLPRHQTFHRHQVAVHLQPLLLTLLRLLEEAFLPHLVEALQLRLPQTYLLRQVGASHHRQGAELRLPQLKISLPLQDVVVRPLRQREAVLLLHQVLEESLLHLVAVRHLPLVVDPRHHLEVVEVHPLHQAEDHQPLRLEVHQLRQQDEDHHHLAVEEVPHPLQLEEDLWHRRRDVEPLGVVHLVQGLGEEPLQHLQ